MLTISYEFNKNKLITLKIVRNLRYKIIYLVALSDSVLILLKHLKSLEIFSLGFIFSESPFFRHKDDALGLEKNFGLEKLLWIRRQTKSPE